MSGQMIHAFEQAGLGVAPFALIGVFEKRGPISLGHHGGCEVLVGAPGQPMGRCDFCGTAIAECYQIRSSDGKTFVVGCECVRKTDDAGLTRAVDREARRLRNEARHRREDAKCAELRDLIGRPDVQQALASQPHPIQYRAEQGETFLDSARWMMQHAGASGQLSTLRSVKRVLAQQAAS